MNKAEDLNNWMSDTSQAKIDAVLEFLSYHKMLNEEGENLKQEFWSQYLKEKGDES